MGLQPCPTKSIGVTELGIKGTTNEIIHCVVVDCIYLHVAVVSGVMEIIFTSLSSTMLLIWSVRMFLFKQDQP